MRELHRHLHVGTSTASKTRQGANLHDGILSKSKRDPDSPRVLIYNVVRSWHRRWNGRIGRDEASSSELEIVLRATDTKSRFTLRITMTPNSIPSLPRRGGWAYTLTLGFLGSPDKPSTTKPILVLNEACTFDTMASSWLTYRSSPQQLDTI